MPPEPLPWDRKELFRDRKHGHDRSEALGPVARWRDSSSSSSSYGGGSHRNNNNDFSPRWGFPSDFRRGPGYGKQGGWHMYPEDSTHGYPTTRSGDRFLDDNGFRPSFPRGDGRYGRFYRENRASFNQKEWRGHSWETNHHQAVPPYAPSRPHFLSDQKSVGDSPRHTSYSHSDPCDPGHSKDQADKATDVSGSSVGQRLDKQNSLGSLDWKPFKWSRSGSLTSRGSGFSHSGGSKSFGGETSDLKGDMPPKNVSPVRSPPGDTIACAPSVSPSEETASRKKPRLGWGEGLAKYEKKKVEGPEENACKVANATSISNVEPTHSLTYNLVDKSPRVPGTSDCSSPATPSSVACSSSPGVEDKAHVKTTDADGDANNFCASSMDVSEKQLEGHFGLEKLELNSISNLSSLLDELLQIDDQYSSDSAFVKSAFNKLLLWKGDISKELEMTETEIDSLENEIKSLKSDSGSSSACQATVKLSADSEGEPCENVSMIPRPPPLEVVSSEDVIVGETLAPPPDDDRGAHTKNKDEDIDSPGTATSKFVEPLAVQKLASAGSWKNCSSDFTNTAVSTRTTQNLDMHTDIEDTGGSQGDVRKTVLVDSSPSVCHPRDNVCDTIITSNRGCASSASEVLFKLLPSNDCQTDFMEPCKAPCLTTDLRIGDRFSRRHQSLKFKEKVIAFKYRAFQHLWKEDLRLLSLRNQRMKLQKKNDLSLRVMQSGSQKHRSSIRSRFSSPAGSLSQVPMADIINYTGKLLSEAQVKIYRSSLKMPAMILDDKEKMFSSFVSSNGLVEDPCAMEKERALINPWTVEEREIFMDKLATHGKDFCKIASFLNHKTTADCIEFYYKNHKSECFEKTKKKPELKKQEKPLSRNAYLVTSGKKWSRELNAASLDILGAASVIAAQADEAMEPSKLLSGRSSYKRPKGSDTILEASSSYYAAEDERETVAADALAGICGSLSSEAMSSCITSSVDHGDGNQEWKQQRFGYLSRQPLTPEVTQNIDDDTYSDESCGEMDPVDWTDDEKVLFVQAFSSYGKDFVMISRCVRTKSREQCKVFFSKARKCLDLDRIHPGSGISGIHASNDANGGGSDAEDACIVETGSVICSDKSGSRMDEDLPHLNQDVCKPEVVFTGLNKSDDCTPGQLDPKDTTRDLRPGDNQADVSGLALLSEVTDVQDIRSAAGDSISRGGNQLITEDNTSMVQASVGVVAAEVVSVSSVTVDTVGVGFFDEKPSCQPDNRMNASSPPIEDGGSREELCQRSATRDNLHSSVVGGSTVKQGDSSLILKSFPIDVPIKAEVNGDTPCKVGSGIESRSFQNCYLRKCSQPPSENAVGELPFLVKNEDQVDEHPGASFPKTEKPSRNGDVKLFGKILRKPTSTDRPTPSAHEEDDKAKLHLTMSKFDMKLTDDQDTSTSGKHDHNSFLGLENVPIRSYGFWDGTKIQTGFSSLPDSALLLAKYPAAFASYSIPSPKTDQQPLQVAANANGCNMNSAVFSPREFNSSNGSVVEHPVYRNQEGVQPFRLDMKPRQDSFPEVQRNGFEVMSSLQQQGKGLVKLNVVQGGEILVGGPCTGISDPVAALKLHYARTQQYGGGHGGNGVVREETWRGQGDVGR